MHVPFEGLRMIAKLYKMILRKVRTPRILENMILKTCKSYNCSDRYHKRQVRESKQRIRRCEISCKGYALTKQFNFILEVAVYSLDVSKSQKWLGSPPVPDTGKWSSRELEILGDGDPQECVQCTPEQ